HNLLTLEASPGRNLNLVWLNLSGLDLGRTENWMKTTIFRIEGMNCDACANSIKSLVEKEPGVRMASVSFSERLARVLYDPRAVQEDHLVDVIQQPGFRVVSREAATTSARRGGLPVRSASTRCTQGFCRRTRLLSYDGFKRTRGLRWSVTVSTMLRP